MIHQVVGDLLNSSCDYICHQVNCQGRMGSGIAKSIKERWPAVYTGYMDFCNYHLPRSGPKGLLGQCQIIGVNDNLTVINMFGQESYGYDGKRYTSYDAFWSCLGKIREIVPKGAKIGFPKGVGCGLGGANWNVIYEMINQVLGKDYNVYIYSLEGGNR